MNEKQIRQRAAFAFAMRHHDAVGQTLPYVGGSYIQHPLDVALVVCYAAHADWMIDAALLHDTVDDTSATLAEIETEFGSQVAQCVYALSTGRHACAGQRQSRPERKALERSLIASAAPEIKTVRLADVIVNCRTIVQRDPNFAGVYLPEKQKLIEVLHGGDLLLLQAAGRIVGAGLLKLAPHQGRSDGSPGAALGDYGSPGQCGIGQLKDADLCALVDIHTRLSPEVLSCDGEIPREAVRRAHGALTRSLMLKGLELGLALDQIDECAVWEEFDRRKSCGSKLGAAPRGRD